MSPRSPRRAVRSALVALVVTLFAACESPAPPRRSPPEPTPGAAPDVRLGTGEGLVSTVPSRPFPRNRQSEVSVAVDPTSPRVVVAGMNDVGDVRCRRDDDPACIAIRGVGVSGVSFSLDGGVTWGQPSYEGAIAGEPAPIHTLPGYREAGLVARGDPTLAFGPRPARDGTFSWANGTRLYYANIATRVRGDRGAFEGRSAIAVSRTDHVPRAARGDATAWRRPSIASRGAGDDAFNDKPWIAVDDAASSPYFGTVYACWTVFGGIGPSPTIVFSRSVDGGATWSRARALTTDANVNEEGGRQGCQIATDADGAVLVAWIDTPKRLRDSIQVVARSTDGGRTFTDPRRIAAVEDIGERDPLSHDDTFDGAAGSRSNSFPSIAAANGAPTGETATGAVVVAWADGEGGSDERALVTLSFDRGRTWTEPADVAERGDRPAMVAVGISPDGRDVYVVYEAFASAWRPGFDAARPVGVVIRHATLEGEVLSAWETLHRGATGDARGATTSTYVHGTLYDYNDVVATTEGAVAVWADARRVESCRAVDRYRARRLEREESTEDASVPETAAGQEEEEEEEEEEGPSPIFAPATPDAPDARRVCPDGFGDVDVFGGRFEPAP